MLGKYQSNISGKKDEEKIRLWRGENRSGVRGRVKGREGDKKRDGYGGKETGQENNIPGVS